MSRADGISRLLDHLEERGERPLLTAEGLEVPRWTVRAVLGRSWLKLFRVKLIGTNRRLLEVALGPGRRPGRIRSFPSAELVVGNRGLHISLSGRRSPRWRLLERPTGQELMGLRALATGAQAGDGPDLCSRCFEQLNRRGTEACGECHALPPSKNLARALALVWPGGGLFYCGWIRRGAWRAAGETFFLLGWAILLLSASSWWMTLATVLGVPPFLLLMKLEATAAAAELAPRAPPRPPEWGKRWRRQATAGAILTAALLVLPIPMRGILDDEVQRELRHSASWRDWRESDRDGSDEGPTPNAAETAASTVRTFLHASGLQATLTAKPLPRWLPQRAAALYIRSNLSLAADTLEPVRLGHHSALTGESPGQSTKTLYYLVLDTSHRDVHQFRAEIDPKINPAAAAQARAALESLIRRTYFEGL